MTDAYLTAAQLAFLLDVPKGTIWYWASVDQWPRTADRLTTRYLASAAQASYDARRDP
jgi:hypothetical protein